MDSKVTLDVKSILIAGLVLLGLVLAYLVGSADDEPAGQAAAAEETAEKPRSLVMSGTGKVTVVPDQLAFTVGVSVKRVDVETAWNYANGRMDRILAALEDFGVTKDGMQSVGLSIDPDYQYYSYQPPQIVGYRVSQRNRIVIDDLKKAGQAISAAVHAGGNAVRVSGIALQVGDREDALMRARDEAVEEAKAKAARYADAADQSLGQVLSLKEVRATPQRDYGYFELGRVAADAAGFSAVPIRAGEEELTITVRVVWAFE